MYSGMRVCMSVRMCGESVRVCVCRSRRSVTRRDGRRWNGYTRKSGRRIQALVRPDEQALLGPWRRESPSPGVEDVGPSLVALGEVSV